MEWLTGSSQCNQGQIWYPLNLAYIKASFPFLRGTVMSPVDDEVIRKRFMEGEGQEGGKEERRLTGELKDTWGDHIGGCS